jgi:hypothetical protein
LEQLYIYRLWDQLGVNPCRISITKLEFLELLIVILQKDDILKNGILRDGPVEGVGIDEAAHDDQLLSEHFHLYLLSPDMAYHSTVLYRYKFTGSYNSKESKDVPIWPLTRGVIFRIENPSVWQISMFSQILPMRNMGRLYPKNV